MCGISSIYRFTTISINDQEKLVRMNDEMAYRGPDDRGVWHDDTCGMAQVRLSIIGLQKGKQPLFNEDHSLVLICNGEIYNYIELKQQLIAKGHVFSSDSDSETILHLYEEYGEKCLEYLRGMFSFCLWNARKKELFVARDRIGEKTLYYAQIPTGIVISTELKAIVKHFIPNPQIDLQSLAEPIRYTSPLNERNTYVEQVKRVLPGEYLIINETGLVRKRYWKRDVTTRFNGSFEEAKQQTLDLMRESVNLCLRSDVPVAVMLSGGIDSSTIAALAKESGREVHTITAGYKGQHSCDEREVARRFAKERGCVYHEIELDVEDFKDSFEELTSYIDEPITDAAAIAQWALYKKVKSLNFKVLLGGMGGDELFYGYPYWNRMAESLATERYHKSLFPWKGKKLDYLRFIAQNFKYVLYAGYPMKMEDRTISFWQFNDYQKFSKEAKFQINGNHLNFAEIALHKHFDPCPAGREIDSVYKFSFDNIMTMAYLYLSDRLGMGNSLEIRSPLLDYKLVEFVSGLPLEYKYKKNAPKYFLKETLKDILPDYILYADKKGFTPPDEYINDVAKQYNYNLFTANHKFYNSVLADSVLSKHIMGNV
jgi:asparagine synthase (glutamine-hydrolysing)